MNLKELSSLLGLSQTTVSRALNGYPEVSEVTRARVAEAARAHNYHPNPRAQGLATGHARSIGHVLSVNDSGELVNPIFGDFVAGASEIYAAAGYDMMVTLVDAGGEADAYRSLKTRGAVDGVVVHAPRTNDPRIPLLNEIGLPFVVHGRATGCETPYDWLDVNNRSAFGALTTYLLGLRHRRIALINGSESLDFSIRRRSGFEAAMAEAGLPVDPELLASGEMTEAHGYSNAATMLGGPNPPTAFIVSSIICAIGVRRAADERALKLGRDVSVATFDDCLSYLQNGGETPIYTAARSSVRAAGEELGQMLLDRINAPDGAPNTRLWDAEIVEGSTTGPCLA